MQVLKSASNAINHITTHNKNKMRERRI